MKTTSVFLTVMLLIFLISSCKKVTGEGPSVEETRDIAGFIRLNTTIDGDVYYTPGPEYKITLRAQRNILDIIETRQQNDELSIYFKNVSLGRHDKITVSIQAPDLNGLQLSGSGRLLVTKALHPLDLQLNVSGSGSIELPEVVTGTLSGGISGSGSLTIQNGSAAHADLNISGSGNINFLSLSATTATVHISGSGSARLGVTDHLTAHISGSGNVYYRGSPEMDVHVSGSGNVRKW